MFASPMDVCRYQKVLQACALQQDLDMLPAGDMTEIGEKVKFPPTIPTNIAVSARIGPALARCYPQRPRTDPILALTATFIVLMVIWRHQKMAC